MANSLFNLAQKGEIRATRGSQMDVNGAMKYCNDRGITPKQAVLDICKQRGLDVNGLMSMLNR